MSTASPLKIGFLLPSNMAVGTPGNGIRAQAVFQAQALRRRGHEVVELHPWHSHLPDGFDVIQFFLGGLGMYGIETGDWGRTRRVFAPIIDTNESNTRYRAAARLGHVVGKVFTIPGVFRDQALGSDAVVVRSSHERERLIQGLSVPAERVHLVTNGVDPPGPADPALARERLCLDLPDGYALHASAYTQARKNVRKLIEAVGPTGLPLVVAGHNPPGPALDAIQAAADRFPNVHLRGFLDRETLQSLYAGCKVFCLPSVHEGTGLVALEAASYGARVVITPHGGPPDYFLDHAVYPDPQSVASIRQAVQQAWDQPPSDTLRKHIVDHLTWDASAEQLETVYRRAIASV